MNHIRDRFTGKMFRRLYLPSLLTAFGLAFADMADALVVGRNMGATGLAAISLALPVYMTINLFMHSLGAGGSVRFSSLLGEGKKEEAQRCYTVVFRAALLISVILAILGNIFLDPLLHLLGATESNPELYQATSEYLRIIVSGIPLFFFAYILNYFLRNDENQRLASVAFIIGNCVDVALNIIFVLILGWGVKGAAWSTLIGYAVTILLYLPGLFSKKHNLKLRKVKPDPKKALTCLASGFSVSSQYLLQMIFLIIVNNVLLKMTHNENGVAVFDMLQNVSYLVLYLYDASGKAAQPLISTYYGERNMQGQRNTLRLALISGTAVGGFMALLICVFPPIVCKLFGLSEQALIDLATPAMRIFCLSLPAAGVSTILEIGFQASGREKAGFVVALLRGGIVLLPMTLVFSLIGNPGVFWWLFPVTEFFSLGLSLLITPKFRAKRMEEKERILARTIMNKNEDIGVLTQEVEAFCEKWEASPKQTFYVTMTIEEICLAIMQNAFDQFADGYIQMTLVALPEGLFELHIRDNATAFDPFSLAEAGGEGFNIDAAGMKVIKNKAKDFFYRRYQGFNALVVRV